MGASLLANTQPQENGHTPPHKLGFPTKGRASQTKRDAAGEGGEVWKPSTSAPSTVAAVAATSTSSSLHHTDKLSAPNRIHSHRRHDAPSRLGHIHVVHSTCYGAAVTVCAQSRRPANTCRSAGSSLKCLNPGSVRSGRASTRMKL